MYTYVKYTKVQYDETKPTSVNSNDTVICKDPCYQEFYANTCTIVNVCHNDI